MTTSKTTTLARKITLALGAIVVSTMTLAAANQAQAGVKIYLGFGGFHGSHGIYSPCAFYKYKWYETHKWYWKKKYYNCMGWW